MRAHSSSATVLLPDDAGPSMATGVGRRGVINARAVCERGRLVWSRAALLAVRAWLRA